MATAPESWMPVPARLVRAVYSAPTERRRVKAIAQLTFWILAFHGADQGDAMSVREVCERGNHPNKDWSSDALNDARRWWGIWTGAVEDLVPRTRSRTLLGQSSDTRPDKLGQQEPDEDEATEEVSDSASDSLGQPPDDHARSSSTSTSTGTGTSVRDRGRDQTISEDCTDPPTPAVDPPEADLPDAPLEEDPPLDAGSFTDAGAPLDARATAVEPAPLPDDAPVEEVFSGWVARPLQAAGLLTVGEVCRETRGQLAQPGRLAYRAGLTRRALDHIEERLAEGGRRLLSTAEVRARIEQRALARPGPGSARPNPPPAGALDPSALSAWRRVVVAISAHGQSKVPGLDFRFAPDDPVLDQQIGVIVFNDLPLWSEVCQASPYQRDQQHRAVFLSAWARRRAA